jgi:ABC-type phosphate transport system substrate-binding protein
MSHSFVRTRARSAFLALSFALGVATPLGAQSPADVAVVVHSGVPIDNMTIAELRHIVLGEREYWPASMRVTLLVGAEGSHERAAMLKDICQMTEEQFRQHWIAKMFRADTAVRPRSILTNDEAVNVASQTPGAIAFVDASKVGKNLKVLKIDGKTPGQKGYALN